MIYRSCDIRGAVGTELTPELYRYWGIALASLIPKHEKFLVARDCRPNSAVFSAEFAIGLQIGGASVVNLGELPYSVVSYASRRTNAFGFAVITGFGGPEEMNGLRWTIANQPPDQEHLARLRETTNRLMHEKSDYSNVETISERSLDVTFDYVGWLQDTWFDSPSKTMRIALDPMGGSWAFKARRYLQAVFPNIFSTAINDKPGGPGFSAAGSERDRFADIGREVDFQRADIGFLIDEDGERLGIVDPHGVPLSQEEFAWLILESFGDSLENEVFVHDSKCSRKIIEQAKKFGAIPVCSRCGHTCFYRKMATSNAPLGLDSRGGVYFRAIGGELDPLFSVCWVLDYIARTEIKLDQWRLNLPGFHITPEIGFSLKAEEIGDPDRFLDAFSEKWAGNRIDRFDGVLIELDNGWIIARKSLSGASLSFRVEGNDEKSKMELVSRLCSGLSPYGNISQRLWTAWMS